MKLHRLLISTIVTGGLLLVALLPAHAVSASIPPGTFRSAYNNRCLDADLNTIGGNGTKVQLWDCLGSIHSNQDWWFETTSVPHAYRIHSGYNNRCLDADLNTIGGNGTKVQLWDCLGDGQTNQLWAIYATRFTGIYQVASFHGGRCLDADLSTIGGNGTKVQLWDCLGDGQTNQDWLIDFG
jgi:predicted RNA-binding protein